jgi:two-component system sensor histidine kinase RegB
VPQHKTAKNNTMHASDEQISGQSLILARWIAIFGQAIAILVSFYGLGFGFPVIPCMGFVVLSGLVNNYAYVKDHHRAMPASRAFYYLAFDMLQLTGLLYLTGGIDNPFSVLLLAPVLVGASLLPRHYMMSLLVAGVLCAGFISAFHMPLDWPSHIAEFTQIHEIAQTTGISLTLVFTAFYAWRIAEESRAILKASHAARTALLKQKQLQALGAQAAAAVHELGSPLGTITIIAKELALELGKEHPQTEDVNLLIDQTKRCQIILRDFGATLRHDPTYLATPISVPDMVRNIATEFLKERPEIRFLLNTAADIPPIQLPQSAELIHGLGVFIQNAIQFAQTTVTITLAINKQKRFELTIRDDGHGFAPQILSRLGEPYTSTRIDNGKNMGLGIFIAQTLLEETGVMISYNNHPKGGAQVKLEWTEDDLRIMVPTNTL